MAAIEREALAVWTGRVAWSDRLLSTRSRALGDVPFTLIDTRQTPAPRLHCRAVTWGSNDSSEERRRLSAGAMLA